MSTQFRTRRIVRGNPSSPAQTEVRTTPKDCSSEQVPSPTNDLDNADTLDNFVVGGDQSSAQTEGGAKPRRSPSEQDAVPTDRSTSDTLNHLVSRDSTQSSVNGRNRDAAQGLLAVDGAPSPAQAIVESTPSEAPPEQDPSSLPVGLYTNATQLNVADREGWTELRIRAENFHDAQEARITVNNRADRGGVDKAEYLPQIEATRSAEEAWKKFLLQQYRRTVPEHIRAWQAETPGVGEHTLARLLGHIGHPVFTTPHRWEGSGKDRMLLELEPMERRVSDLWSYCGHGDPTRKRRKGMTSEDAAKTGNPKAKVALRLLAYQAVRQIGGMNKAGVTMPRSPYRDVYEKRKAITAERASWEGTRDAHRHEDALRIVGKEILRDLWKVARG